MSAILDKLALTCCAEHPPGARLCVYCGGELDLDLPLYAQLEAKIAEQRFKRGAQ